MTRPRSATEKNILTDMTMALMTTISQLSLSDETAKSVLQITDAQLQNLKTYSLDDFTMNDLEKMGDTLANIERYRRSQEQEALSFESGVKAVKQNWLAKINQVIAASGLVDSELREKLRLSENSMYAIYSQTDSFFTLESLMEILYTLNKGVSQEAVAQLAGASFMLPKLPRQIYRVELHCDSDWIPTEKDFANLAVTFDALASRFPKCSMPVELHVADGWTPTPEDLSRVAELFNEAKAKGEVVVHRAMDRHTLYTLVGDQSSKS